MKKTLSKLLSRIEKISPIEIYIFIFIVSGVVFATRYYEKEADYRYIRMEVTTNEWINNENQYAYKVPFWISQAIEAGQTERSPSGRIKAEIVQVDNYERGNDQAEIYLVVKLMADFNEKSHTYSYNGQDLSLGEKITFNFDNIVVPGQILDTNYPKDGYEEATFIVTARYEDVEPWLVEKLEKNTTMKNRATGEVIAEVLNFTVEPSDTNKIIKSETGEAFIEENKDLQDVIVDLKLTAHKKDGNWFFQEHQRVRIGSKIWIYLDEVNLNNITIENLEYVPS